jgi:regulatory protein
MEEEQHELEFKGGHLTALSVQKGNPDRLSLFVDDEFAFGVRREVAYHHNLKQGLEVTADFMRAVWEDEESYRARDLAVKYLGLKPRTRKQMADYLAGKEIDERVVAATVAWLSESHYLDDEQFARSWVEGRMRSKPRGTMMLRWELKQKGLDADDIQQAIEEFGGEDVQLEAAVRLLEKKVGRKILEFTREEQGKLAQFLARKGFTSGVVYEALRRFRQLTNLDNH